MAEMAFQKTLKLPRSSGKSIADPRELLLEQCAPLRHRGRRDKLPDELHRRGTSGVNPGTGTKELQHVLGSRSRSTCSANTHIVKQRSSMQKKYAAEVSTPVKIVECCVRDGQVRFRIFLNPPTESCLNYKEMAG